MSAQEYESVTGVAVAKTDRGVLEITIDRPSRKGAVNDPMGQALINHFVAAGQDEAVRAILLRSTGDDFCAGSDLVAKNTPTDQRPRVGSIQRRLPSTFHRLIPLVLETQVPVVCAVRGWAAGLGFQLALASDFCIAARDARFWQPFVDRGFSPDSGATWLLPRFVGLARAREVLMLGRELTGQEAAEWGLIHAACETGDVDATASALADQLAGRATVALGLTKWLLTVSTANGLADQLRAEAFALEVSSRSEDFREGLRAFGEKREPEFRGR